MRTPLARTLTAVLVLFAMLMQGSWAYAGTTGSISGVLSDASGTTVAGARVTATSPSQSASVTTDASGRYAFVSLAPDTYTLSFEKQGFQTGIAVGHHGPGGPERHRHPERLARALQTSAGPPPARPTRSCGPARPPASTPSRLPSRRRWRRWAAAPTSTRPTARSRRFPASSCRSVMPAGASRSSSAAATTRRPATKSTASRSTAPSTSTPPARSRRWAIRKSRSTPATRRPTRKRSGWPASSTRSFGPERIPATSAGRSASARRQSTTTPTSRSAEHRPTGCSPTTSAPAATARTSASSTSSMAPGTSRAVASVRSTITPRRTAPRPTGAWAATRTPRPSWAACRWDPTATTWPTSPSAASRTSTIARRSPTSTSGSRTRRTGTTTTFSCSTTTATSVTIPTTA